MSLSSSSPRRPWMRSSSRVTARVQRRTSVRRPCRPMLTRSTPAMPVEQRRPEIAGHVRVQTLVRVGEPPERFGVSEVTISADLKALDADGHIRRVRGGAVSVPKARPRRSSLESRGEHADEKEAHGAAAAALVQIGKAVFIDVGTTATAPACPAPRSLPPIAATGVGSVTFPGPQGVGGVEQCDLPGTSDSWRRGAPGRSACIAADPPAAGSGRPAGAQIRRVGSTSLPPQAPWIVTTALRTSRPPTVATGRRVAKLRPVGQRWRGGPLGPRHRP